MKPTYIFIVGSFRSGTTLLRSILDSTDDIAICWETHLLGHFITAGYLKQIHRVGDLSVDENAIEAVDYMFTFDKGYWHWFRRNVDRQSFTHDFLASDRSDKSIFKLIMQAYAGNKTILGEKTPSHLYHVPTLLSWFPNSKIIHTLRDPRAIFISEVKKKDRPETSSLRHRRLRRMRLIVPYVLLQVTLTWLRAVVLHKKYERNFPDRYMMVRLEDLLLQPEKNLRKVERFLGTELPMEVLGEVKSNSSFLERRGKLGLDVAATDRWRKHAKPWIDKWFKFWFRRQMREYGYL